MTEEGRKKVMGGHGEKIEEYTRKKAAEMQMIGLQATELYLQTEEAYFSAVLFYFFSSILVLWYFSSNLDFCFFSKWFCCSPLEVMKYRCITHLWTAAVYTG